jgi:hypothetical protein
MNSDNNLSVLAVEPFCSPSTEYPGLHLARHPADSVEILYKSKTLAPKKPVFCAMEQELHHFHDAHRLNTLCKQQDVSNRGGKG